MRRIPNTDYDLSEHFNDQTDDLLFAILLQLKTNKLNTAVNFDATGFFSVQAKTLLQTLVIVSATTQVVKIGTTIGGGEIFNDIVNAGVPFEDTITKFFAVDTQIFVTITGQISLYIYKA